MWFGNGDALISSCLRDCDNFHAFPNNEEGRRAITKINDLCRDAYVVMVGSVFYVAVSVNARDKLLDKLVLMLDRKFEKLKALQEEVDDLKDCIEILGY